MKTAVRRSTQSEMRCFRPVAPEALVPQSSVMQTAQHYIVLLLPIAELLASGQKNQLSFLLL